MGRDKEAFAGRFPPRITPMSRPSIPGPRRAAVTATALWQYNSPSRAETQAFKGNPRNFRGFPFFSKTSPMLCVYRWHLNRRILARERCKSGIFPHCAVYRQRGASVAYTSAMAHLTARYREPIAEKGLHIPPFSAPFPFEKTPFLCRLSAIPADHPRGNGTGSTCSIAMKRRHRIYPRCDPRFHPTALHPLHTTPYNKKSTLHPVDR